jgi:nucleoid-associated protein YgaU
LEPFLVTVDKSGTEGERKEALVLDPLWRQELGKSTYEWVNAALIASEIPASPVRHASSAGFEQLDAQMLLAAATALIAQAARTQPPASPSA